MTSLANYISSIDTSGAVDGDVLAFNSTLPAKHEYVPPSGGGGNQFYSAWGGFGARGDGDNSGVVAVDNVFQHFFYTHSGISDLTVCPLSFFDVGAPNNGRFFTAPRDGFYAMGYNSRWNMAPGSNAGTTFEMAIFKNTILLFLDNEITSGANIGNVLNFGFNAHHAIYQLQAGDVIEFMWTRSGANFNQQVDWETGPIFYMYTVD
jgi:hypothetical protein